MRGCITDDSNTLRLGVKLSRSHLDLALSCRMSPWVVSEVNSCRLKALNVSSERTDMDLRVRLDDFDAVFEINWAVTFDLKLLLV